MNRSLLSCFSFAAFGMLPLAALAQAPVLVGFSPASGSSGQMQAPAAPATVVTITGTFLSGVTAVVLNGQHMPIVAGSNSATQVQVTVPRGALSGRMRITTAAGTALTATALTVTRPAGTGTFRLVTSSFNGLDVGTYSTAATTDLDHDGLIDLLVGETTGTITRLEQSAQNSAIFNNLGTVKLQDGTTVLNNNNAGNTRQFAKPVVADLDGDGLLDLLVGAQDGFITQYEQSAVNSGTFVKVGDLPIDASDVVKPSIVDLDNDGLLDLIVGSADGLLRRYEQTSANGPFSTTAAFLTADGVNMDAGNYSKPVFTDMDGDGLIDMIVGNQDGTLYRAEQTAAGAATFTALALITDGNNTALDVGAFSAPSLTDVDGDGYLDLLVGNDIGTVYQLEQIVSDTRPLPVTLTSFTGAAITAGNQLRWTTAQEVNSARFVVERSADGVSFQPVGTLAAAGNSSGTRTYQYLDATTLRTAYYRLRQVDTDGTTAYSSVVVVTRAAAVVSSALAFPNPFEAELRVALPAGSDAQPVAVSLTTLAGQTVYSRQLPLSSVAQTLPGLPELKAGTYVLRLTTAAGSSSQRVVRR
ncbi:T9SS type A sorting domain-containing protein [Hymenobacter sp. 102]|uniref:T9SS type A sorting domain-containing protein n=1 Tax=Hymenobacter sp. 102 TaxID=3403152 RepID=UPI003CF8279B